MGRNRSYTICETVSIPKGCQGSDKSLIHLSDCSSVHFLLIHSFIHWLFNPSLNQFLPDLPAGSTPQSHHSSALRELLDHHQSHRRLLSLFPHLADVHAGVTAQRPHGGQVVSPQQSRDDAILVHLADHGGVHEIHQPVFIHCDTCQRGEMNTVNDDS